MEQEQLPKLGTQGSGGKAKSTRASTSVSKGIQPQQLQMSKAKLLPVISFEHLIIYFSSAEDAGNYTSELFNCEMLIQTCRRLHR